jgi:hypothetical protein
MEFQRRKACTFVEYADTYTPDVCFKVEVSKHA